jgi:hypothetical protein
MRKVKMPHGPEKASSRIERNPGVREMWRRSSGLAGRLIHYLLQGERI